jgi:hypothetical protein
MSATRNLPQGVPSTDAGRAALAANYDDAEAGASDSPARGR